MAEFDYNDKEQLREMVQESVRKTVQMNEAPDDAAAWYLSYALNNLGDPNNMSNDELVKVFSAADELGFFYKNTPMVSSEANLSKIVQSEEDGYRLASLVQGAVDEIKTRPNMDYVFNAHTEYGTDEIDSILDMIDRGPAVWDTIVNFVSSLF